VPVYVAVLILVAAALGWTGLLTHSPDWSTVAVLTFLGATGASLSERELGPHLGVSFATVVLAAAVALVGPGGAVVVGFLSHLLNIQPERPRTRLFNAAMTGILAGVGGFVYLAAGGEIGVSQNSSQWDILVTVAVPLVIGYAAMTLLNTLLIGVMIRLVQGGPVFASAWTVLRGLGWGYLVHVLLGLLLVILWEPVGIAEFSAVLILGPLLLVQWLLSRDASERRAHARTVSTLMAALELANPYSVGHSARVAALCERMGRTLGVSDADAEILHYAALLHDLGLVATAPRLPRGSGPVNVTYLAAVVEHPEAGVRMLQDIDFLAPALPGILHHHERMDGRGYPAGLTGEEIPLTARMIAVADAFDSLTTTRSYRPALEQAAALAELRARAGSHLDPKVVQALEQSLEEKPWSPTLIADVVLHQTGDVYDHDDPVVSDRYASWQPEVEGTRA
jgi:HD-GYP domain-containing protein (c-di-GMP phosphodiesterase class II)